MKIVKFNDTFRFKERMIIMPNPIVTITMQSGNEIKIELYPEMAPNTVNNFIFLAKNGFYAEIYRSQFS